MRALRAIGRWLRDRAWDFRWTNTSVLYIDRLMGVVRGRIRWRREDTVMLTLDVAHIDYRVAAQRFIQNHSLPLPPLAHIVSLADEGTTWVRQIEGEDADAFCAAAAMDKS